MVLEVPFAAVSSSGREVSDGIHAIWAGRKTQPTSDSSVATTSTTPAGAPTARQAVATTASAARSTSLPMSTILRGRRSASTEPIGEANAMSSRRTAPHTPTRRAPPTP